jgi:hypothetical protein
MIRGISVMRRTADSWVNATQILKVAGIPKSSRTKILDKEIAAGIHEKVQGGCKLFSFFHTMAAANDSDGKYQGTWYDNHFTFRRVLMLIGFLFNEVSTWRLNMA